jgi:hypothetical protein
MAPDGDGRAISFGGARRPPSPGGGGWAAAGGERGGRGRGAGRQLAAGGVQAKADHAVTQNTGGLRIAASCQCGSTRLPSRRRLN